MHEQKVTAIKIILNFETIQDCKYVIPTEVREYIYSNYLQAD